MSADRFTLDVIRAGFAAISEEMFTSLQRTSQSPVIYEVLDFGVGISDRRGELVSQGNGIAGFLGPLGDVIAETLARVPDLAPGDVIIANDPYAGGGTHLSDVALVRPVFWDSALIGFAAAKGHWTDIGGKDPGSWTADSTDVYAEGLQLPFLRACAGGAPVADVAALLAANSRLPQATLGDLSAQSACLEVAERRLHEMCARYGAATVTTAMAVTLDRSEALARLALEQVPHGSYEASGWTDGDGLGNGPFAVRVRVELRPDGVTCDFTGSHGQVPGPINCTWSGLVSGVRTVFKAITDPAEPATDGQHGLVSVGDGETYVIPAEVAEQRYGIRVARFGFDIVEGAGAGRRRGGRGLVREYEVLSDDALLTVAWGRHSFPPWGAAGGRAGSPNYVEVIRAGGRAEPRFGKASRYPLRRGDVVRLVTGTGGGYGDPREREPGRVAADLADGLITEREATEVYGSTGPGPAGRGAINPDHPDIASRS
jgi:N-methylhydantoinase B/oxoprolinase/acetone carboxylase alpha subunit